MKEAKKFYDFVYLTNTPSFYKLNLCEQIAERASVLLVFYGYGVEAVNRVLRQSDRHGYDYVFLHEGDAAGRSKMITFVRLLRLMRGIEARRVLFSGWLATEYNVYSFLSPRRRNVVVCESAVWDIEMRGLRGLVKRAIIGRMSAALPSGVPHVEFFRSIRYKGMVQATGSVGIFHKGVRRERTTTVGRQLRYIYVGRLVEVKNVGMLIDVFNRNGKPLTIVGTGYLEEQLKAKAGPNIKFTGFIPNDDLGAVYQAHDVFILPSTYEPWGLVVEEALYWGLPVVVSDRVGSSIDMVQATGAGCIFHSGDAAGLERALDQVEARYAEYRRAAEAIDWEERDRRQVAAYLKLLGDLPQAMVNAVS